jgi:hypothetical protein
MRYVLATGLALAILGTTHGGDREVLKETPLPELDLAAKGVRHEKTGRMYTSVPWTAKKGQLIDVQLYSHDHQPEIVVHATDAAGKSTGKELAASKPEKPYPHPDTKKTVYWASVTFVAGADATYRVFLSHTAKTSAGKFHGTVTIKDKETDVLPLIAGCKLGKSDDVETVPTDTVGKKRVLVNYYNPSNPKDLFVRLYGFWVPSGGTPKDDWDKFLKPGGLMNLASEKAADDVLYRVFKSGGRQIIIASAKKMAYVELDFFSKSAPDEKTCIEAGRKLLAKLEERAADR